MKCWLNKKDKHSTSNLRKHTKSCFGEEALRSADELGSVSHAHEGMKAYLRSGDLTTLFVRTGKGKVTYSVCQHTRTETRYIFSKQMIQKKALTHHTGRAEIVCWVSESMRPFAIVDDRAFQSLMKTGWPEYWIPLRWTVARDVQRVFTCSWMRIAKLLQVSVTLDKRRHALTNMSGLQWRT